MNLLDGQFVSLEHHSFLFVQHWVMPVWRQLLMSATFDVIFEGMSTLASLVVEAGGDFDMGFEAVFTITKKFKTM
jgi:hypothetical protein